MNPEQPQIPPERQTVDNHLMVMQPGEEVLCEIKRHPFGLIVSYIMCAAIILGVAVLAFGVVPAVTSATTGDAVMQLGIAVVFIMAVLSTVLALILTKIYWGNSWLLTSDSLTQVNQTSLFNRQSSQLSLSHIEDVSAEQNGILPHIFGFGLLKVETAGEHSKFHFHYCPNPNYYAQKILSARETFAINGGHQQHATNRLNQQ